MQRVSLEIPNVETVTQKFLEIGKNIFLGADAVTIPSFRNLLFLRMGKMPAPKN